MSKLQLSYRFVKYCLVGGLTTLEGWTIVYILTEGYLGIKTHYIVSSMIGTPIVWFSAFALNNWWTWGKNDEREITWLKKLFTRLRIAK